MDEQQQSLDLASVKLSALSAAEAEAAEARTSALENLRSMEDENVKNRRTIMEGEMEEKRLALEVRTLRCWCLRALC